MRLRYRDQANYLGANICGAQSRERHGQFPEVPNFALTGALNIRLATRDRLNVHGNRARGFHQGQRLTFARKQAGYSHAVLPVLIRFAAPGKSL